MILASQDIAILDLVNAAIESRILLDHFELFHELALAKGLLESHVFCNCVSFPFALKRPWLACIQVYDWVAI